jgi:AcrR family transcriptional regulator
LENALNRSTFRRDGYSHAVASLPEHLQSRPVGRSQVPRELVVSHQRDRILDAATEVFAKRGYRATTIDHIVAAAQIGVGSFYELFENKQDCLLRAFDRVLAATREQVGERIPAAAPWSEQATAALRALVEISAARPASARLALVVIQTGGAEGATRYEAMLESAAALLRSGRDAGSLPAELPDSLEQAIVGGAAWFLQQRLEEARLDPAKLFPELAPLVLEPYLGEAAAAELIAAQVSITTA